MVGDAFPPGVSPEGTWQSVGGRKAAVMSDEAQPAITMITMDRETSSAVFTRSNGKEAHAVGVEGHLPAPGATVVRPGRRQPWQVVAVTVDTLRLRDLIGDVVEVSRRSVRPDPLDVPTALGA